jgi:hypothetical protein
MNEEVAMKKKGTGEHQDLKLVTWRTFAPGLLDDEDKEIDQKVYEEGPGAV